MIELFKTTWNDDYNDKNNKYRLINSEKSRTNELKIVQKANLLVIYLNFKYILNLQILAKTTLFIQGQTRCFKKFV